MANPQVRRCVSTIVIALAAVTASIAATTASGSVVATGRADTGAATVRAAPQGHAAGHARCVKRHGKRVRGCARKSHRSSAKGSGSTPTSGGTAPASGGTTVGASATFSTTPDCSADPLHVNCAQLPLDFITTNDCIVPPPFVEILGVYHVAAQTTVNSNGTTTLKAYTNYQNSFGQTVVPIDVTNFDVNNPSTFTQAPNPTKYQANLTDHEYERTDPSNTAIDESFDETYELISNDSTPNMLVHFGLKIHIDTNGVPVVVIGSPTAKCTS
jgi:hypothetical protein